MNRCQFQCYRCKNGKPCLATVNPRCWNCGKYFHIPFKYLKTRPTKPPSLCNTCFGRGGSKLISTYPVGREKFNQLPENEQQKKIIKNNKKEKEFKENLNRRDFMKNYPNYWLDNPLARNNRLKNFKSMQNYIKKIDKLRLKLKTVFLVVRVFMYLQKISSEKVYRPGGTGYLKCLEHFNLCVEEITAINVKVVKEIENIKSNFIPPHSSDFESEFNIYFCQSCSL